MNRITLLFSFLFVINLVFAQDLRPVVWSFDSKNTSEKEVELVFKASIIEHWHLYGQDIELGGPIPTTFYFTSSDDYQLIGDFPKAENGYLSGFVTESEGKVVQDKVFEMKLKYFDQEALFTQKVKVISNNPVTIKGYLEFMTCNNEMCLPPEEIEFEFKVQ